MAAPGPGRKDTEMQSSGKEREPPVQNKPYALYNSKHVQRCYLHRPTMEKLNAWILRGMFTTPDGKEVSTLIPTQECFLWHNIDDDTRKIFQNTNLDGYFQLPPWGADVKRAWQLLSSLGEHPGTCRVEDLGGNLIEFGLTNDLISTALNLQRQPILPPLESKITDAERSATTNKPTDSTFDHLREPRIRRALEAFMLHLSFTFAHRFTKPKFLIACHFTKALRDPDARRDFSPYILKGIELASRQKINIKRGHSLSGILALTRVAYAGIGSLDQLPPAESHIPGCDYARKPKTVKRKCSSQHDQESKGEEQHRSAEDSKDQYALSRNQITKRRLDPQQEEEASDQEAVPYMAQVWLPVAPAPLPQEPVVPNEGSTAFSLGRFCNSPRNVSMSFLSLSRGLVQEDTGSVNYSPCLGNFQVAPILGQEEALDQADTGYENVNLDVQPTNWVRDVPLEQPRVPRFSESVHVHAGFMQPMNHGAACTVQDTDEDQPREAANKRMTDVVASVQQTQLELEAMKARSNTAKVMSSAEEDLEKYMGEIQALNEELKAADLEKQERRRKMTFHAKELADSLKSELMCRR